MKYNKLAMQLALREVEVPKKKRVEDHMEPTGEMTKKTMNYSHLAEGAGLSRETVFRLRGGISKGRGSQGVTLDVIDRICTFLQCQPSDIMELND